MTSQGQSILQLTSQILHPPSDDSGFFGELDTTTANPAESHSTVSSDDALLDYDLLAYADCVNIVVRNCETKTTVSLVSPNSLSVSAPVVGKGRTFEVRRENDGESRKSMSYDNFYASCFAIKSLRVAAQQTPEEKALSYRSAIQEIRVLMHPPIIGHPSFLQLKTLTWWPNDQGRGIPTPVLHTEFAYFGTVCGFLETQKRISLTTLYYLILDVVRGLWALHGCSIAHGDMKMDNILVTIRECSHADPKSNSRPDCFLQAKLSDFAFSVDTSPSQNQGQVYRRLVGYTPLYAAPEAKDLLHFSKLHSTDIYSLGLVIWGMLNRGKNILEVFAKHQKISDIEVQIEEFDRLKRSNGLKDAIVNQIISLGLPPKDTATFLGMIRQTVNLDPDMRHIFPIFDILHSGSIGSSAKCHLAMVNPLQTQDKPFRELKPFKKLQRLDFTWAGDFSFNPVVRSFLLRDLEKLAESNSLPLRTPTEWTKDIEWRYPWRYAAIDARAALKAAQIHQAGIFGAPKSREKSLRWLRISAQRGHKLAQALYSTIQENGTSAAKEPESDYWLLEAASNGCQNALEILRPRNSHYNFCFQRYIQRFWIKCYNVDEHTINMLVEYSPTNLKNDILSEKINSQAFIGMYGTHWLHGAAMVGNLSMLRLLIERHGFYVDSANERNETSLFLACRSKHWPLAHYLLSQGADPGLANIYDELPLHWIVLSSITDREAFTLAQRFLQSSGGVRYVNSPSIRDESFCEIPVSSFLHRRTYGTPLHWAVHFGNIDMIQLLLSYGADPWFEFGDVTPVCQAARFQRRNILSILLSNARDVATELNRPRGRSGSYIVHRIHNWMHTPLYLEHVNNAAGGANTLVDVLALFSKYGCRLDKVEISNTLLYCALQFSRPDILCFIIGKGFTGHLVRSLEHSSYWPYRKEGGQPLEFAVIADNIQCFDLLVQNGADIFFENKIGGQRVNSLLQLVGNSQLNKSVAFAHRIIGMGMDVNIHDSTGFANTTLYYSLISYQFDLAGFLINQGAHVNVGSNEVGDGNHNVLGVLLRYAPSHGLFRILSFLIDHPLVQMDFIVAKEPKLSVYHAMCLVGWVQAKDSDPYFEKLIFELLYELFPEDYHINAESILGCTPLHFAVWTGRPLLVKLLLNAGADPYRKSEFSYFGAKRSGRTSPDHDINIRSNLTREISFLVDTLIQPEKVSSTSFDEDGSEYDSDSELAEVSISNISTAEEMVTTIGLYTPVELARRGVFKPLTKMLAFNSKYIRDYENALREVQEILSVF